MRNALKYYYNIYCQDIIKTNNNYKIIIDNGLYYLVKFNGNIAILNNIYDFLIKNNIYCHEYYDYWKMKKIKEENPNKSEEEIKAKLKEEIKGKKIN